MTRTSESFVVLPTAKQEEWFLHCDQAIKLLIEAVKCDVSVHVKQSFTAQIARLEGLIVVARNLHPTGGAIGSNSGQLQWQDLHSAFQRRILTGAVYNVTYLDPKLFLQNAKPVVLHKIGNTISEHRCVKVNTCLHGEFVLRENKDVKSFNTANCQLFVNNDLNEWYDVRVQDSILRQLEEFQERDSGWALHKILNLTININRCESLSGSGFVELPEFVRKKNAVVNVRVDDGACFAWSVVAAIYPAERDVGKVTSYPHYDDVLEWSGLQLPMTLKQIARFETTNSVSINVFIVEGRKIVPLQLTERKMTKHVNLLMIDGYDGGAHFCWIKNFSRLISSQISAAHGKVYVCDRCLHVFRNEAKLLTHSVDCEAMNHCKIDLPKPENNVLKFTNYSRREPAPFVVYADFECLLENVQENEDDDEPSVPSAYQKHTAYSVGYYLKCSYDSSLSRYEFYRGPEPAEWLVAQLHDITSMIQRVYEIIVPMHVLSDSELLEFTSTSKCHICSEQFLPHDIRVRDHCHFTGKYRGPAHQPCNLNYKAEKVIPVVFHNLTCYDAHFIIRELVTRFTGTTSVIPLNKEKYISFTKRIGAFQLRFIDSFKFLDASLDKLVSYLPREQLSILREEFKSYPPEKMQLLFKKGVFPYDWLDSMDKYSVESLPSEEEFYNYLTESEVKLEDYKRAEEVWREFDIQTMGQYSDLYLKTDVLLLADVFENFRKNCMIHYSLDPAHYYTIPGLAWDAMLRITGVELQLFTDIDMVLFVERGIRGGLSQCSNRYSRANNRYTPDYDPSQPSKYLMYFDVVNLYGWAMSQCLPFQNFSWMTDPNFDVNSIADDAQYGYILEVDMDYPQKLHDLHRDLPFCPTRDKAPSARDFKLLATVKNKKRYVIHYRNLKQCLAHGLRLKKIHRILKFEQKPWLRSYIDVNTHLRAEAKNDFEKNLFKLMNNAVFGKTMENVRNHIDIRLVTKWEGRYGANALIAKPSFHRGTIFSENFMAIEMRKLLIKFNKPIYVGMSILDISKTRVYDFHHSYMLNEFGDRCKLMYTDTDSLLYEIRCDDIYQLIKRDAHKFDTSDYPTNNVHGISLLNKKVPGLMKDEYSGVILEEYVALRSKMYALRVGGKEEKRLKGIKRNVVQRCITFQDYLECLRTLTIQTQVQQTIRSSKHIVYSISEMKVALSPHDTKRYIIPNSTDTLPWGHYAIPEN